MFIDQKNTFFRLNSTGRLRLLNYWIILIKQTVYIFPKSPLTSSRRIKTTYISFYWVFLFEYVFLDRKQLTNNDLVFVLKIENKS